MIFKRKKAAIELSVGTIVIIVIGVSMLILGMVLVRSIMCKTIGLTEIVNGKVEEQLNTYFGDAQAEVACIGEGGQAVKLIAGKTNYVFCTFRVPETAKYTITLKTQESLIDSLKDDTLKNWIKASTWSGNVAPGDKSIQKPIVIQIPSNAPEGPIRIQLEVKKNADEIVADKTLDFEISRVGVVRNTVC